VSKSSDIASFSDVVLKDLDDFWSLVERKDDNDVSENMQRWMSKKVVAVVIVGFY